MLFVEKKAIAQSDEAKKGVQHMKNGWIKLHRALLDSSVFADAELLRVLLYCVLQASYRELKVPVGRQVIELQPGQLLYGRRAVSNRLGIGESKLRGLMHQLETLGMIEVQSSNRYSIVTIVHWAEYQQELDRAEFPFDCDFLEEQEPDEGKADEINFDDAMQQYWQENQQENRSQTEIADDFHDNCASKYPEENHKQEEENNNKIKKEEEKSKKESGAALRAVRRYRRTDGESFSKGSGMDAAASVEGHNVPGGVATVPCWNDITCNIVSDKTEPFVPEQDPELAKAICHDTELEMAQILPDNAQLTQMEHTYWQQYEWYHADECNLTMPTDAADVLQELNKVYAQKESHNTSQEECTPYDLEWDLDEDCNWVVVGRRVEDKFQTETMKPIEIEDTEDGIDPDEQEWIAAHQLFNQLWNQYPIKEGKQKVSDTQIMELYSVGKKTMNQAIRNYKEKKHRVPKKYWMNGSTFFNGGY